MPSASGRLGLSSPSGNGASIRLSRSSSGRLSTTSHPMSSSVRRVVDLPAPESPETSNMVFGFFGISAFATLRVIQAKGFYGQFDLYRRWTLFRGNLHDRYGNAGHYAQFRRWRRWDERSVGKAGVSTCRSWWS